MDVHIAAAVFEDLNEIVELERQCFSSEAFSRHQIFYLLRDYGSISLVARVNGEAVGFVILQIENNEKEEGGFGHIITLNVAMSFRRMGVAQKLLFRCEELLKLRGVEECRLEVRASNYEALELYRRMGYVEVELLERYYGKENGLYFKKKF